ncbi:MAG: hypothetical protein LBB39_02700, partial [Mycoplasmataceae bacterium]|nr:hypothetical protein [Mycoplasmataceae bacterium]
IRQTLYLNNDWKLLDVKISPTWQYDIFAGFCGDVSKHKDENGEIGTPCESETHEWIYLYLNDIGVPTRVYASVPKIKYPNGKCIEISVPWESKECPLKFKKYK